MNTQALIRFHVGLKRQNGEPTTARMRTEARAHFASVYPDGFTLTPGAGQYNGGEEPTWTVEVYADSTQAALDRAHACARRVRAIMDQECVGLAVLPVATFELI